MNVHSRKCLWVGVCFILVAVMNGSGDGSIAFLSQLLQKGQPVRDVLVNRLEQTIEALEESQVVLTEFLVQFGRLLVLFDLFLVRVDVFQVLEVEDDRGIFGLCLICVPQEHRRDVVGETPELGDDGRSSRHDREECLPGDVGEEISHRSPVNVFPAAVVAGAADRRPAATPANPLGEEHRRGGAVLSSGLVDVRRDDNGASRR
mmetsp:Transcript_4427/g.10411  ORF Transcript_4427/g.10411 Transcript_4427/m.10411 type:complete len:204 (+) Transcript_4427:3257-3868(+)